MGRQDAAAVVAVRAVAYALERVSRCTKARSWWPHVAPPTFDLRSRTPHLRVVQVGNVKGKPGSANGVTRCADKLFRAYALLSCSRALMQLCMPFLCIFASGL